MALKGPIRARVTEEREDRHNERLETAWVRQPNPPDVPERVGEMLSRLDGTAAGADKGPLLVVLGADTSALAWKSVERATAAGSRVYVLADQRTFDEQRLLTLTRGENHTLFRRVADLSWTAVIRERGAKAGLVLGGGQSGPEWYWSLGPAQGAALFRLALRMFWHDAVDEGWLEGKRIVFRDAAERPFDVPLPHPSAPVRFGSRQPLTGESVIVSATGGDLRARSKAAVVAARPSGEGHETLAALQKGRSQVFWSDLGLPDLALDDEEGRVRVGAGESALEIALELPQVQSLRELLVDRAGAPEWKFETDLALGDVTTEVFTAGAAEAQKSLVDVDILCATVRAASLGQFEGAAPAKRPPVPTLAKSVVWRWTVEPPRVPSGAKDAPLVAEWGRFDQEFHRRVQAAEQSLQGLDERTTTLGKAFAKLKGAVLGFGTKRGQLLDAVRLLEAIAPSAAGPTEAARRLDELVTLEESVDGLRGSVDDAERKAREEQELQRQQTEFEERKRKAAEDLERHRAELEKLSAELRDAQADLEKLNADDSALSKKEKADLRARKHKRGDEAKRLETQVKQCESRIQAAERTLAEEFKPRPGQVDPPATAKKQGARFVPEASSRPTISPPRDALPEVGRLVAHDKKLFLVIKEWGELGTGEIEAKRLDAALVGPEEGK